MVLGAWCLVLGMQAAQTVSGVVFLDRNGNGKHDS